MLASHAGWAQVTIQVDVSAPAHPVSPYLYGRNNSVSDNPEQPLSSAAWTKLRDAGVMFLRESGGNNSTKYNWRRKLSSHPDWYNNVYAHDWDYAAKSIQEHLPGAQGMWSFQLIGKAAKTTSANFNDWAFNNSDWWIGTRQNLAGGGTVDPAPTAEEAIADGDPTRYLETWSADSTVGILDHWFGDKGIGLDPTGIVYWNMDNEAEVWHGTHDDIMPEPVQPEDYMQMYFAVAKKARNKFPGIKLVGPVATNEWQWYNWPTGAITYNGKHYAWLEYFIKRVAEEQQASGLRLLDVLDIHYYPSGTDVDDVVQYHRVFFDKAYVYPEANGVKTINGGWDDAQENEYILQRCREWLEAYMGAGHGVTFSVTETGIPDIGPDGIAVWYASTLGEFMRQPDMELFSPWHWYPQMWEVLHLFSRYNKSLYLTSVSGNETLVSAYPTINASSDSITVMLVNRADQAMNTTVAFNDFILRAEAFDVLTLDALPAAETFQSHAVNALNKSTVTPENNKITLSLPPLSVVGIVLRGTKTGNVTSAEDIELSSRWDVFPNPSRDDVVRIEVRAQGQSFIELVAADGKVVREIHRGRIKAVPLVKEVELASLQPGVYFVRLTLDGRVSTRKVVR